MIGWPRNRRFAARVDGGCLFRGWTRRTYLRPSRAVRSCGCERPKPGQLEDGYVPRRGDAVERIGRGLPECEHAATKPRNDDDPTSSRVAGGTEVSNDSLEDPLNDESGQLAGEGSSVTENGLSVAATALAARGWPVFPCKRKRPLLAHGLHEASTDPVTVGQWWSRDWPDANIAVGTGAESGLLVLDVDGDDGADTLHELEREHDELPASVECLTGAGRHIYLCHPGQAIRNSVRKLGAGLDVRGDGGYVIAPPSMHESGRAYEWVADRSPDDVKLAEAPKWLLDLLTEPLSRARSMSDEEPIAEGKRNAELTSLAGSMRRRGMNAAEIYGALAVANRTRCQPPLSEREVEGIAESVARYQPAARPAAGPTFEVLSARATCELPDRPGSQELLGQMLMRGNRLLVGAHTGEGKTTFCLQAVYAVTSRSEFLGWRGAGGRALIIDAEQGLRTVKRRLREAGLHESDAVDYVRVPDGLALDSNHEHVDAVAAALDGGNYAVVVADPLYKLHTGDSNDERAAVDLMRRFDAWREQYGFALILPVHCRKPPAGAKFTIHEFFGSSAYPRGAEVIIGLQRLRDGYSRLHFFKDRDGDLPIGAKWGLLFGRKDGFRRDPEDEEQKQSATERVQGLLEAQPQLTLGRLVAASGYSERTIRRALKALGADDRRGPTAEKLWTLDGGDQS